MSVMLVIQPLTAIDITSVNGVKLQGGNEKIWDDLKALGFALTNPKETVISLMNLVTSPEALAVLGTDVVNDLKLKSVNVYNALISDTAYEGEKANKAGRDLGELALTILEAYTGIKGVTTGVNAAKGVLEKVATNSKNVINDVGKAKDVFASVPKKLDYVTSSGVKLEANPNKTTTVLGSYTEDIGKILDETKYPKTLDFEAKQGGFNILNTPDKLYKTPEQFWNEYNKPFLDKAIERGDDIVLATKPDPVKNLTRRLENGSIEQTGFGREINYLELNGYKYDSISNKMIKGK